jgi:hypothetical protein
MTESEKRTMAETLAKATGRAVELVNHWSRISFNGKFTTAEVHIAVVFMLRHARKEGMDPAAEDAINKLADLMNHRTEVEEV